MYCVIGYVPSSLMQVIKIKECEIYSYNPDFDGDPFSEKGAM